MKKINEENIILMAQDSYKNAHPYMYPAGTTYLHAYMESRGGPYGWTRFFGLQYYLIRYLSTPITKEMVEEAAEVVTAHGLVFPFADWMYIVNELKGAIPVKIRAVPEGTIVPNHNVLMTVESTDPKVPWVTGFVETLLLKVWYGISVNTLSMKLKSIVEKFQAETCDAVFSDFSVHDFGARGVSSVESSAIGGMAHLASGFKGSDTMAAVVYARNYYSEDMAAFSVPASEHSVTTAYGRDGEAEAYSKFIDLFDKEGGITSLVLDSYDIVNALDKIIGTDLHDKIVKSKSKFVARLDSGDPKEGVLRAMRSLEKHFGVTVNSKGYKVLNHCGVLQGDGVDENTIYDILKMLKDQGYAAENVVFGIGGKLLQAHTRDDHRFAYKLSYAVIDGVGRDIMKDPISDSGKRSKPGILELVMNIEGAIATVKRQDVQTSDVLLLEDVFMNGEVLRFQTLQDIRER